MKGREKYFLFNREAGFKETSFEKGLFLTGTMDSMEYEMEWHRLTLNGGKEMHVPCKITVYAAERDVWKEKIANLILPLSKKLERMEQYRQKTAENAGDILLHGVKGRYLWISLEILGGKEETSEFHEIKVYFPRNSWIDYLPEIYQREDYSLRFLERYLGIFQTFYEDLNREIDQAADLFDVALADKPMLQWMASWLDMEESHIWSKEQLRKLLSCGASLFKYRGTRAGIMDLVELYTGEKPLLVECCQLQQYAANSISFAPFRKIYPRDRGAICILVRERVFMGERTREGLMQVIDMTKPVSCTCHLIVLSPYLFLGGYSYVGINSGLETYEAVTLTQDAALSLAALTS